MSVCLYVCQSTLNTSIEHFGDVLVYPFEMWNSKWDNNLTLCENPFFSLTHVFDFDWY